MVAYGGLGGATGGRPLNPDDLFEAILAETFGYRVKTGDDFAASLWGALANVHWRHQGGDTAAYSFRAAGDVIAAIRGAGCYMDWYCSGSDGVVPEEIRAAMAAKGWTPGSTRSPR